MDIFFILRDVHAIILLKTSFEVVYRIVRVSCLGFLFLFSRKRLKLTMLVIPRGSPLNFFELSCERMEASLQASQSCLYDSKFTEVNMSYGAR